MDTKLRTLSSSLATIELALEVIDRIRNNYLTEESRIYLAENEKDTWLSAIQTANAIYAITADNSLKEKMYSIARRAKASVLRNEIFANELLYSSVVPDTLLQKKNTLAENIAAYNRLILLESQLANPDSSKISLWKDALFEMNRSRERVSDMIDSIYPQYHDLLLKSAPLTLAGIRKKLKRDETVIDYMISNQYANGKRKLYIFVVTKKDLEFLYSSVDSSFAEKAEIIHRNNTPDILALKRHSDFVSYTGALSFMYETLFGPVENLIKGKRVIIIPDEEIAWLPFDAFIKNKPSGDQKDFEGLQFLVYDYHFSSALSSSLIFGSNNRLKRGEKVFSFSPDYSVGNYGSGEAADNVLNGAQDEISSIYKWFSGKEYTGAMATETNFRKALQEPAIFHLAMHLISDTLNSAYSYLLFDNQNDSTDDGRLYNYEIELERISSPMVVLSACNSGTGTLYHGEGEMSLARSFILAGASSVVKTSWEVNDAVSNAIISRFYYFLVRGYPKDESMSLAKIQYIRDNTPQFSNPYYWAAYEVLGDNEAVTCNKSTGLIIIIVVVLFAAGSAALYLRRRRSFPARS